MAATAASSWNESETKVPAHAILTTDSSGQCTFDYSDLGAAFTPAVTALPLDPSPSDGTVYLATLVSADSDTAVIKVFATSAVTVLGVSVLTTTVAATGIGVHATCEVN